MKKGPWHVHLLVLLGYLILAIAMTWPLAVRFCSALPGEGTDSWQYLWNFWWFDQALFHGQSLYFTRAQYYPQGTSLLFHTLSPLNSLLGLPVRLLGGYLAAYNSIVLLSTVLSGYGAFLLVKEVLQAASARVAQRPPCPTFPTAEAGRDCPGAGQTGSALSGPADDAGAGGSLALYLAAFTGGAIFALCPYRSVHLLGHLSLVSTETLPFFALFAWRAIRRPGWKPALGLALSWLAAALIDWYYPLYMVLLAAFFLAWALGESVFGRRSWAAVLRTVATLAGGLLTALLVLSPLLVPMLRQADSASYLQEPLEFSTTYGADLAAFFLPSPLHPLWGKAFTPWTDPLAAGNTAEGIVYLGFVPLALAGVGFRQRRRAGIVWAAMASLFGLLSLGPYLKVLNQRLAVPLPYLLLHRVAVVRFTRVPSRYAVLLCLGIAVLAGLGLWSLLGLMGAVGRRRTTQLPTGAPSEPDGGRVRSSARPLRVPQALGATLVAAALLALIVLEYVPAPYPLTPAVIPPFYEQLAQDPDEYALLELPLQRPASPWYYTRWMLYQTVHGKPSFRGYISRGDPLFPFAGAPLFRQLANLGPAEDIHYDDFHTLAPAVLAHYNVGYIVLERSRLEEEGRLQEAQSFVQEVLGVAQPTYADRYLLAYRVERAEAAPFLRLAQGWHEVEEHAWGSFRWMERDRSDLYVILPDEGEITLEFQAVSFLRPRQLEVTLDGAILASMEIGTTLQPYHLRLRLPAAEARLRFRADSFDVPLAAGVGEDPRPISIGFSDLRLH